MSFVTLHEQKRCSASDAVGLIRDGDTVIVPTGVGEPPALLSALLEPGRLVPRTLSGRAVLPQG